MPLAKNTVKQNKQKRRRRLVKPGGIRSLEYGRQLRINAERAFPLLSLRVKWFKNYLRKYLKSIGPKGVKVYNESGYSFSPELVSEEMGSFQVVFSGKRNVFDVDVIMDLSSPAIRLIFTVSKYPKFGQLGKERPVGGTQTTVNIKGIGPVSIEEIYRLNTGEVDKYTVMHERSHTKTSIARHNREMVNGKYVAFDGRKQMTERLLNEFIASFEESPRSIYSTGFYFDFLNHIKDFVEVYGKRKGWDGKRKNKIKLVMKKSTKEKSKFIFNIVHKSELSAEEIIMVLRKSTWDTMEEDLNQRISDKRFYMERIAKKRQRKLAKKAA